MEMANTGLKKKSRRKAPWSDLPTELMEFVLQNCDLNDQARLRAVCRTWQSIPRVQPRIRQLPWLMVYDHRKWSTCNLFDLTYNKTHIVNTSTMKEYFKEQKLKKRAHISICASKSGWLLLSHHVRRQFSHTAFFLYSPFSNKTIKLPNLHTPELWVTATFSADPTSADCVFFAFHYSARHANTVAVSTYRIGDTTWSTRVFPNHGYAIKNVVYSEGHFVCATYRGRLATFSVAQKIWNVLESPAPVLIPYYERCFTDLVESNGNLLLVIISHKYKRRYVFKLDRSQMAWISVEDIGDQTLFLGPTSFSVSSAPAKFRVSGKIHYCCYNKCRFLSRNFKRSYYYPKRYGLLANKECLGKIWIEPPC